MAGPVWEFRWHKQSSLKWTTPCNPRVTSIVNCLFHLKSMNLWIWSQGFFLGPDLIAINKWHRNSPCTTLLQTITSLKQNLIGHTKIKSIFARHHHPPPTEALQSNTNIWKNNSVDTIYFYIFIYIYIISICVYTYIYQKAAAAIWEWHPSRENIVRNFVFLSTSISTPRPKKTNLILSKPKRLRRQSRHEGIGHRLSCRRKTSQSVIHTHLAQMRCQRRRRFQTCQW